MSQSCVERLTDGDHGLEVGVPLLEPDEPPVTVVVALAGVAVGRAEVVPRIPHLGGRIHVFSIFTHNYRILHVMYSTHNSLIPYPYLIGVLIDVGKPVETMSAEHGVDVINVKFAQAGSGKEDEFTNKMILIKHLGHRGYLRR